MTLDAGGTEGGGLPGVIESGPAPEAPSRPAAAPSASPAPSDKGAEPGKGKPAGPTPEGEATSPTEDAPEIPGDEPAVKEDEAEAEEPFTLAGKTFKSVPEAENYIKAQDGRVKALTGRIGEYASSAVSWQTYGEGLHVENESLRAELAKLKGGAPTGEQGNAKAPTTAAHPEAPTDPNGWLDGLNWQFYGQLAKDEGPEFAGYWLAEKIAARMDSVLEERMAAKFGPIEQREQAQAHQSKVEGLFTGMARKVDDAGAPIYPELLTQDAEQGKALVEIWASLPPEIRDSEDGVEIAVAKYRMRHGAPRAAAEAGTASGASRSIADRIRRSQAANATTLTGDGTPRPGAPGSAGADLNRRIREAGSQVQSEAGVLLGFRE